MKISLSELERYIANKIAPRLGLRDCAFTIDPRDLGNRNCVLMVDFGNGMRTVLKGYRKKRRIHNALLATSFLKRCGIAVPQTLFSDLSERTCRQLGFYIAMEQRLDGCSLAEAGDITPLLPAIASFYAGLHAVSSSRWGKLRSGRKFGFGACLQRQTHARLERLSSSGLFAPSRAATCRQWLQARSADLSVIKSYSLCHGDVNLKNMYIDTDHSLHLIDCEAIKYLPFPMELIQLEIYLCAESAQASSLFEQAYFAASPPQRRSQFERCSQFFRVCMLLEFSAYLSRKLTGAEDDQTRQLIGSRLDASLKGISRIIDGRVKNQTQTTK